MQLRGGAGVITSVFDIADVAESAKNLINCLREEEGEEPCSEKEKRDNIAGITFGSVSFISGVAFLAMPGAGTVVGFALMVGQAVYSGISNIKAYEDKYDITRDENWRIFWHTVAFQPIPQDVQKLAADTEVFKRLAEEAWRRLENSTDVVATAMGL
ncbi:hypothetical protein [Wolbachia endosymbiont (group E) of Neria commutata]|uniref:hypothetical protein n=1 Tax=Wolbachia endosymbiont (group E) of Neria commutata TaxID=3066149 RepID=UPI003132EBE6